jgi:2-polyprenyl-3-methyl-5-hydroxy-6-metoxy-1,4-benzoquinol methylase
MPTIDQNIKTWEESYKWVDQGDEWSRAWGGPSPEWFGTILPRLKSFIPAKTILEIAPGFGRWTQFLKVLCDDLILVDISSKCIEACRSRFAADPRIQYHVNDGRSLSMVADDSIDLVFSFDSLVHVEADVIVAYLEETARTLRQDGVAFIHHSNIGEYVDRSSGQLPADIGHAHGRALSVSAETVRDACQTTGLCCVSQEMINWGGGKELIDAITVVARPHSRWAGQTVTLRNSDFNNEVRYVRGLSQLYDWGRFARGE